MAEKYNFSSSLNSTQESNWNPDIWCADYLTGPVIWATVAITCFFLGFPASLWVLHDLIQRQRHRSTSDIFMFSLTVVDLMFTSQLLINVLNFMFWQIRDLQMILSFIYSFSVSGRPLFMAGICWDCYMAVVYPIMYKTSSMLFLIKKLIALMICVLTVVGAFIICHIKWLIITPAIAYPLVLSLPVITFCNISIIRTLKKTDPTRKSNIHPQKKQALHTILTSFIMTFVVYLPPMIIFLFGNLLLLTESEFYCCLAPHAFNFMTFGCVIMPVLYLLRVGKLDSLRHGGRN